MSTMNVSLPEAMKDFIDEQVVLKGYGSSSEYIRDLLRKEQGREHLRGLLIEGLSGPVVGVADKAYFDGLRRRIRDRGAARAAKGAQAGKGVQPASAARPAAKAGARSTRRKA